MGIPLYWFTGFAAVVLAIVAAYFSITGLGALYAAAFIPVVIMGAAIEFAKVVGTFWLHRNFHRKNWLWIIMMIALIIGAMGVTSGGVYGYLSKGHLDQNQQVNNLEIDYDDLNTKIAAAERKRDKAQENLDLLDAAIKEYIDRGYVTRGLEVKADQKSERDRLNGIISEQEILIADYNQQRKSNKTETSAAEAKLGPVKYLAKLFGASEEDAVIYFTLLMVLLLDPFAILLVVATSIAYDNRHGTSKAREIVKEVEKIVEREVPVEVEKLVEVIKEVEVPVEKIVEVEKPITSESITEFLENAEMQKLLEQNPALLKLMKEIIGISNAEQPKKKPARKSTTGWFDRGEPLPDRNRDKTNRPK